MTKNIIKTTIAILSMIAVFSVSQANTDMTDHWNQMNKDISNAQGSADVAKKNRQGGVWANRSSNEYGINN